MGYTHTQWLERHRARADITSLVTHLTREADGMPAVAVLAKMLTEGRLVGSGEGFTVGHAKVVCFQEAPILGLAQNIQFEQQRVKENGDRVRYIGVGVAFRKIFIFGKGGRPVIYDTKDAAKEMLPKSEHWRIVPFDLSEMESLVDWTHEREWRIRGDLEFPLGACAVILQSSAELKELRKLVAPEVLAAVSTITVLNHVLN